MFNSSSNEGKREKSEENEERDEQCMFQLSFRISRSSNKLCRYVYSIATLPFPQCPPTTLSWVSTSALRISVSHRNIINQAAGWKCYISRCSYRTAFFLDDVYSHWSRLLVIIICLSVLLLYGSIWNQLVTEAGTKL